jgi:hypothetical protein
MRRTRFFHTLAIALLSGAVHAQDKTADEAAVDAQNPAPINTFEAEGGYRWNYGPDKSRDRESWVRILYKGALIKEEGTPFKEAQSLDLAAPAAPTGAGDRNTWSLRYENGKAEAGGSLLEAEGVQAVKLRGLEKLDLRGTAYVGGNSAGKALQIAAGLESPPMRIPFASETGASNWIVVGINGQHQEMTDAQTGDANFGLVTFRAFLGKAFGWRKSANVAETTAKLENQLLKQAPTFAEGQALAQKIDKIPANQRTKLQQLLLDTIRDVGADEDWKEAVKQMATGTADAITDQPTLAVYGEVSGWRTVSGDPEGPKTKSLSSLTVDYWFLDKRDDMFLRLRYENGYERAQPTLKLNRLMLSATLRF